MDIILTNKGITLKSFESIDERNVIHVYFEDKGYMQIMSEDKTALRIAHNFKPYYLQGFYEFPVDVVKAYKNHESLVNHLNKLITNELTFENIRAFIDYDDGVEPYEFKEPTKEDIEEAKRLAEFLEKRMVNIKNHPEFNIILKYINGFNNIKDTEE